MSPRSPQIQKYTDTAALRRLLVFAYGLSRRFSTILHWTLPTPMTRAPELHHECNSDGVGVQVRKTLRAKRVTVTREARNRYER